MSLPTEAHGMCILLCHRAQIVPNSAADGFELLSFMPAFLSAGIPGGHPCAWLTMCFGNFQGIFICLRMSLNRQPTKQVRAMVLSCSLQCRLTHPRLALQWHWLGALARRQWSVPGLGRNRSLPWWGPAPSASVASSLSRPQSPPCSHLEWPQKNAGKRGLRLEKQSSMSDLWR